MDYFQDMKNRFDGFGFEQQKYLFASDEFKEDDEEKDEEDEEDEDSDTFEENYFG